MASLTPRTARVAFVWTVALALGAFTLTQVLGALATRGPEARLTRLLPAIGAERLQRDLRDGEATYTLEADAGGVPVTLADLPRDTVVFLNFWATWCQPCREELPSMLRLRRELADRRFIMVAVSYDEGWDEIHDFFGRFLGGTPSPAELWVLRDPRAGTDAPGGDMLRGRLGTDKLPDSYVLYNGRILERFVNARDWMSPQIVEYFRTRAPKR